ncbi:MAG: alcohol dehydrogenase catalytic domain-containing protein, partial [Arenicella sp.]|nr:alcohol dehydrogenase catalytic domain-containing protein [Arenicella sp.]
MKAINVKIPGGLDNLAVEEFEAPEPAPGQVLVRWHATSLNFHDYLVAAGAIPVPDGRVPMSDGAGVIEAIGDGVKNWQVGDQVMSLFFPNWVDGLPSIAKTSAVSGETVDGYAQQLSCVAASALTTIPTGYSFAEAATLPCAALTAWRGLVVEGGLKSGDSVLI